MKDRSAVCRETSHAGPRRRVYPGNVTIRVLLVDDDDDIRFLMRKALERVSPPLFTVAESDSGEDALSQIGHIDPAVVVLDEMMPGLSGVQTAERILQHRPAQTIVMCSARLDDGFRERATLAGVSDFVDKGDIRLLGPLLQAVMERSD